MNKDDGAQTALAPKAERPWYVVCASVAFGTFLVTSGGHSMYVALPYIAADFHLPVASIQWVVTINFLISACMAAVVGAVGDRFGQRRVFVLGAAIFLIGAIPAYWAHSLITLLMYRAIQAVGAGMMAATEFSIVAGSVALEFRGRAMGIVAGVAASGQVAGPSLGGFIIALAGWRGLFLFQIPIGLIAILVGWLLIPADRLHGKLGVDDRNEMKVDLFGILLYGIFLATVVLLLTSITSRAALLWSMGLLLSGAFLYWRQRVTAHPLLDWGLLRNQVIGTGLIIAFSMFAMQSLSRFTMPFYLSSFRSFDPASVGLLLLFLPAGTFLMSPVSGWLADRYGSAPIAVMGTGGAVVANFWLATLDPMTSTLGVSLRLLLLGMTFAFFTSPNTNSIMNEAPPGKLAMSSSLIVTVRTIANLSAPAVASLVLTGTMTPSGATQHFLLAQTKLFYLGALLAGIASVFGWKRMSAERKRPLFQGGQV